ncbi:crossover junction endodeoxyribonuclease RuvC [Curtobacterium sp. MCBD17_028]|uniref:crossover junction endodeoxyribonuclease RuvC n=1 Tax=Curtobacterium sp. MCBD17_028 TaxID=2175670 RepID=UPI0011B62541|nr:crossover junction endodeoxyribonuclease RuvC [Curtobacterium sp. MCBD17_028]
MTAVVGLDLSLACSGVTYISPTGHIDARRVQTSTTSGVLEEWRRIRTAAARVVRLVPAPCLVLVEWASYGSKFGAQDERGAHRWLVAGTLAELGCDVVKVSPKQRAKYATGNGNAKKPEVLAAMRDRHPGVAIPDDNVADALALGAMGARWLGHPVDGDASREQQQVMRAVRWPQREGATA